MEKIALKELNQQTSKVVARVRNGERLLVTDHGRNVAMIVPVNSQSVYETMLSAGQIRPAAARLPLQIARVKLAETTAEIRAEDADRL
jgi:prevent-host-death family protein